MSNQGLQVEQNPASWKVQQQSLKILMILHMPWTRNLGGSRVQFQLAEEFRQLGHTVDKFDINDAFPRSNRFSQHFHSVLFRRRAAHFIRERGTAYDVIDAHQEDVPYSKEQLGFNGLLSIRSVGLVHLYEQYLRNVGLSYTQVFQGKGRLIGRIRRWIIGSLANPIKYAEKGFAYADCIIVNNQDEYNYVAENLGYNDKLVYIPSGLSDQQLLAIQAHLMPPSHRLANKQVVFIGYWAHRKGSHDWAEIIRRVRALVPDVCFLFLGTGRSAEDVLQDLGLPASDWIKIVPSYTNEQLPQLLNAATVGAFPTYIEGFPFALLEKLASGLPTVSYDVPGPREMLRLVNASLMVPVGDVGQFSDRLAELLRSEETNYSQLSQRCIDVAHMFTWPRIAKRTLDTYAQFSRTTRRKTTA